MDLGEYVGRQLNKGSSRAQIRLALHKAGHKQVHIEVALSRVYPKPRKKAVSKNILFFISIFLILIAIGLFIAYVYLTSDMYMEKLEIKQCYAEFEAKKLHFLALREKNPSLCRDIKLQDFQAYCLADLTKNKESCNIFESLSLRTCSFDDPAVCRDLIKLEKQFCSFFITRNQKDCTAFENEQVCNMLVTGEKDACYTIVDGDKKKYCLARADLDLAYFDQEYIKEVCEV